MKFGIGPGDPWIDSMGGSERKQGGKDDSQFFSLNNWVSWFTKAEGRSRSGKKTKCSVLVVLRLRWCLVWTLGRWLDTESGVRASWAGGVNSRVISVRMVLKAWDWLRPLQAQA